MKDLDQYYTGLGIAERLVASVLPYDDGSLVWVEPSAGTGAFFSHLPTDRRIGYDIDPQHEGIQTGDFLAQSLPASPWIAIGNPPFGKNASLAVRFFNHCAGAEVIAMIVPRTFRKPSVINRLDRHYVCISDETLPKDSFVFQGRPYDVPCCFQIWTKTADLRPLICEPKTHADFVFCKRSEGLFAVQRVGARAGTVKPISDLIADPSHYFIRSIADTADVRARFEQINYSDVKFETAGNPSISKAEIVRLYDLISTPR